MNGVGVVKVVNVNVLDLALKSVSVSKAVTFLMVVRIVIRVGGIRA